MGDPKTVLEGCVKYRDRKKWKARWAVVSKLSPVADCLHLQLYRDSKERCKNGPTKASLSLEGFLGMETGFTLDKESNTMALICSELVVVLAFDSRELLIQWQVKIRANLAEEQQFLVQIAHVPSKSKLSCGPARLHLQDYTFCIVAGVPPRLLGTWPIKELRRFGVIEGKFCFEGGSLCGKGEGLHVLLTNQSEEMVKSMDLASKGKLLGKRKTLSRKNSVLETSTRTPIHKSIRHNSEKCSTNDSGRPLLSSGSECSTCNACSEILRSCDHLTDCDESVYNSASSTKASSCRIHYRWPSCMSRWGQSSTITTSDVESMDTVSVTLSDYQGASHSTVSSKASSHGNSLLCLCDGQGTWPFNHCNKCGRQVYSRNTFGHPNGGKYPNSPEPPVTEANNGFSPQWTMDAALPSPVSDGNCSNSKKDSAYQLMVPTSDRASLCSHTSRSSSASTASSSGSDYSVPRNYLDTLYDKPRTLHSVRTETKKNGIHNCNKLAVPTSSSPCRRKGLRGSCSSDKGVVCPCHEPIASDCNSIEQQKPACSCWSQLSLPTRNDKENTCAANTRSTTVNVSPSSSPKKTQTLNARAARMKPAVFQPCTCTKMPANQYMHYAVPRAALANFLKERQAMPEKQQAEVNIIENPMNYSEEYDVPKKFVDIIASSDLALKSSLKALETGSACSCKGMKVPVSQPADPKNFHRYEAVSENLQMCTCQRLVLWAGSFVPCLGGPSSKMTEQGWQGNMGISYLNSNPRAVPNHYGTICCEPSRTAELVLVNGKPKHVLSGPKKKESAATPESNPTCPEECRIEATTTDVAVKSSDADDTWDKTENRSYSFNELPQQLSKVEQTISADDSSVNYANLEFVQALPLYENSNTILGRLEDIDPSTSGSEKPPLPPRGSLAVTTNGNAIDSDKSGIRMQVCSGQRACETKRANGSAYELMNFEKQAACASYDDDYLMMQPVYHEKVELTRDCSSSSSKETVPNTEQNCGLEESPDLPLRPFMPFSYPHFSNREDSSEETSTTSQSQSGNKCTTSDALTRRHHLINEDMELRSTRSNSLSELKKMVLLRKRSSSVDGKNNVPGHDQGIKSHPASPMCSPKPSVHRKNSLFSKLNLRSKEKSMSTNEIIPTALPSSPVLLNTYRRCNMHRSADCLKVNEEYANSDDDLSNDNSEISSKESVTMRRSSSVPCRSAMKANLTSPRKGNVPVIPELNDLNKETNPVESNGEQSEEQVPLQRNYSFGSQDKPRKEFNYGFKNDCDWACKKECSNTSCDGAIDIHVRQKNGNHVSIERSDSSLLDPYKSTSSSSSDTSDFIESLSHCSRSSSTSSGSSSDYVRAEDIYLKKCANSSHAKPSTNVFGPANSLPKPTFSHVKPDACQSTTAHLNSYNPDCSMGPCIPEERALETPNIAQCISSDICRSVSSTKASDPVIIPSSCEVPTATATMGTRTRSHSRSPTSSTSSLSTSPSITDYSSSSSTNCSSQIPKTNLKEGDTYGSKNRLFPQKPICKINSESERVTGLSSREINSVIQRAKSSDV